MRSAVHDNTNGWIAFFSGAIGGTVKLLTPMYIEGVAKMVEAGLTAFVCGIAGVAGKEIYTLIKNRLKKGKKL